jgi:hypothetical protein
MRANQSAAFYTDHADGVPGAVRRRVDRAGDDIVEDACHTA